MTTLGVVLWKCFVLRKRHWFLTLVDIFLPVLLFLVLTYGRSNVNGLKKDNITDSVYYEKKNIDHIRSTLDNSNLKLFYTPLQSNRSDTVYKIMRKVAVTLRITSDDIKGFSSSEDIRDILPQYSEETVAIVRFNSYPDDLLLDYDLTIYHPHVYWETGKMFKASTSLEKEEKQSTYTYLGYSALQAVIDMAYIEILQNHYNTDYTIDFSIQQFPTPPHVEDFMLDVLFEEYLPLFTIFSFIFLCPSVLQRVGEEKASGTKEYMKMLGISSWGVWTGWFFHALSTTLPSIAIILTIMKFSLWEYPVIEHTNCTVLMVFLLLYCMASITFCFLIASIVCTPSTATTVGIVSWMLTYFIPKILLNEMQHLSWIFKVLLAVFPNMAVVYGYSAMGQYEAREIGSQWYNLFVPASGDRTEVVMGDILVILLIQTIVFFILTLYIEKVMPGDYGIPRPWNFPFLKLKTMFQTKRKKEDVEAGIMNSNGESKAAIEVVNVSKRYYYNTFGVQDVSFKVYKNNITMLLGENGSGKSTTMSIITGMTDATNGRVKVNELDLKSNIEQIRKIMGLCPQHNLCFPSFTVMEHLEFVAKVKNVKKSSKELREVLEKLGIEEFRNCMVSTLSGGTKRKLCLAMALVNEPEILILDEPTSGMDPESRRAVWDLLAEMRKTKTILVSTHFMEEADVLGDFVVIMAKGEVKSFGTPEKLKSKYDTGLSLTVSTSNTTKVAKLVKARFVYPELQHRSDDSVAYVIPRLQYNKGLCVDLIEFLENLREVKNISVNETTMNDVFLRATEDSDPSPVDGREKDDLRSILPESTGIIVNSGNVFAVLMQNRFNFFRKKWYFYIPQILIAFVILFCALWLALPSTACLVVCSNGVCLNLTLSTYSNSIVYFGGSDYSKKNESNILKLYNDIVLQQDGAPVLAQNVTEEIVQAGTENIVVYTKKMVVGAEFDSSLNNLVVNAMYSANALHSVPISINLAMNAIAKIINNETLIKVSNTPVILEHGLTELQIFEVAKTWLILLPIAMVFLMSTVLIFPNAEISTNFFQMQTMAGLCPGLYWFTNIIFDCLLLLVFIIPCVAPFYVFIHLEMLNWIDLGAMGAILAAFAVSSLPFTYLFSYARNVCAGFASLFFFQITYGISLTVVFVIVENSRHTRTIEIFYYYLKNISFVLCPHFTLSNLILDFSRKFVDNYNWKCMDPIKRHNLCATKDHSNNPCCQKGFNSTQCEAYQNYFLNGDLSIQNFLYMFVGFVIYFVVIWLLNAKFYKVRTLSRSKVAKSSDDSVELQTLNGGSQTRIFNIKNLQKSFGKKQVVQGLDFHLKKNQCFGLLGVNGAGKSTTFRMLTKQLISDEGNIDIAFQGKSIPIRDESYSQNIGYCPQDDCLNFTLTGEQILTTMTKIRGYSREQAATIVRGLLTKFGIEKYAKRSCSEYSGGTKRKLMTCLAFIGLPKIIMLDEPTTGVDPSSRKHFWSLLSDIKKSEVPTSFLLCSHSMDECEKLCDELAIMKNGALKLNGRLTELKEGLETTYKVTIKVKQPINYLNGNLAKFKLVEACLGTISYEVNKQDMPLSKLLKTLQGLKGSGDIENFTINTTSLEDVFLKVARE